MADALVGGGGSAMVHGHASLGIERRRLLWVEPFTVLI